MPETDLMTTDEVAAWLRVTRYSIYRYLKQSMPHYRLGAKHLFKQNEVEAWMKGQAQATSPQLVQHVPLRPKVVRHERGVTVDEALAEMKRFVSKRR